MNYELLSVIAALLAIVYSLFLIKSVLKLPAGNEKMQEIAAAIQEGARAYLGRQYRTIASVAAVVFILYGCFWILKRL